MRAIELDAADWTSASDFYEALFAAIGAPSWHGRNVNALVDSMIYGGINATTAPYTIRVKGCANLPADARTEVELAQHALAEARQDYRASRGHDIEVLLELDE